MKILEELLSELKENLQNYEIFEEIDLKILEIIANHLTKALYNYQLIDDVEEKKTELNLKLLELETLFDISVAISSVLDVDELGEEVLWRSVGILNASKVIKISKGLMMKKVKF